MHENVGFAVDYAQCSRRCSTTTGSGVSAMRVGCVVVKKKKHTPTRHFIVSTMCACCWSAVSPCHHSCYQRWRHALHNAPASPCHRTRQAQKCQTLLLSQHLLYVALYTYKKKHSNTLAAVNSVHLVVSTPSGATALWPLLSHHQ